LLGRVDRAVQNKKAAENLLRPVRTKILPSLFSGAFIQGFYFFRHDQGRLFFQLRFGPAAPMIGNSCFLGNLLNLDQHYLHGFFGNGEVTAVGTFGYGNILEAKEVISTFHLIGDSFFGDAFPTAFCADHDVWTSVYEKYFGRIDFRSISKPGCVE
jgi:hypothetical protein